MDNSVRPWLISPRGDMPLVLILCGVLGSVPAFGRIRVVAEWSASTAPAAATGEDSPKKQLKP
jgi:hypothetical protein